MFDERKEILNGPPKRVYNETLETPTTVSSLQTDLRETLKELHDLT